MKPRFTPLRRKRLHMMKRKRVLKKNNKKKIRSQLRSQNQNPCQNLNPMCKVRIRNHIQMNPIKCQLSRRKEFGSSRQQQEYRRRELRRLPRRL
jgi:hypothetical protein